VQSYAAGDIHISDGEPNQAKIRQKIMRRAKESK
jgi:hypothetical protein